MPEQPLESMDPSQTKITVERPVLYLVHSKIAELPDINLRRAMYSTVNYPELFTGLSTAFPNCFSTTPLDVNPISPEVVIQVNQDEFNRKGYYGSGLELDLGWNKLELPVLATWHAYDDDDSLTQEEVQSIEKDLRGEQAMPFLRVTFRGISCVVFDLAFTESDPVNVGDRIPDRATILKIGLGPAEVF